MRNQRRLHPQMPRHRRPPPDNHMPAAVWGRAARLLVLGLCSTAMSGPALATELEQICDQIHQALQTVPGAVLSQQQGHFRYQDQLHSGCLITLQGGRSTTGDPYQILNLLYPAVDSPDYRDGWRADHEADGPDGSSFRRWRSDLFCLVEGSWDGGDDADPGYQPSPLFSISVHCAKLSP